MKKIISLLVISFLLSACGTGQNETSPGVPDESNSTNGNENGENRSGTDDADDSESEDPKEENINELPQGEQLAGHLELKEEDFVFTVENDRDQDAEIFFSSGQEYDYVVFDKEGKVVKKLSEDMMYTQAIKEVVLAPGDKLTYSASLDEVKNGLSAGEYTIEFSFAGNFDAREKESFQVK